MDNVLKALEEATGISGTEPGLGSNAVFAEKMAAFLRTLIELGPDEGMTRFDADAMHGSFGAVTWTMESHALLVHIASRLEDIGGE